MRRALVLAASIAATAACADSDPAASLVVDGTSVELSDIEALQVDTFYLVSARASDGAMLELDFPTSAVVGRHTCDEDRPGLYSVSYVAVDGHRFSSIYPVAAPAHQCGFELDERGSSIALS